MANTTPPIGLATDTTHEDSGEVDPLKSGPYVPQVTRWTLLRSKIPLRVTHERQLLVDLTSSDLVPWP